MGLFNFFTQEIAIDLGTANTLIIHNDKVVVDEPSIVAKNRSTGNIIAIGKTAQEAMEVLQHALELDDAGAIAVELEVVPTKVAEIITKKVKLLTISMGSGSLCDGQYLFSQDILGYNTGHIPRHSRIY